MQSSARASCIAPYLPPPQSRKRRDARTMTEMCRILSSSSADSVWGSSVGSKPGRLGAPSWWWMWKSRVPFSSHCCRQRTNGMSSVLPEISVKANGVIRGLPGEYPPHPKSGCRVQLGGGVSPRMATSIPEALIQPVFAHVLHIACSPSRREQRIRNNFSGALMGSLGLCS